MDNFYVYCMLDVRKAGKYRYGNFEFDCEPFYIGKGRGDRIKTHFAPSRLNQSSRKNSKLKKMITLGIHPIIRKLQEGLREESAMGLERELIATIGRIDTGTGPLTNMTECGDGMSGYIQGTDTRHKRSLALKGRIPWNVGAKYSADMKAKMRKTALAFGNGKHMNGRTHTADEKRKISEGLVGHSVSPDTRLKIALGNTGKIISSETRHKISMSSLGRKISKETRNKMSLANRVRMASELGITLEEYLRLVNKGLKHCSVCKVWKKLEYFSPASNGTRFGKCRECRNRELNEKQRNKDS